MKYVKHSVLGNKHIPDDEVAAYVSGGWVVWPRSTSAKSGIVETVVPLVSTVEVEIKRGPGRPRKAV